MTIDKIIASNVRLILQKLGISKKDLLMRLQQENIDIKPAAISALFRNTASPLKQDVINKVVSCLGIPVSWLTSQDIEKVIDEWLVFCEKVNSNTLEHNNNSRVVESEKRIESLERKIIKLLQKNKQQIAELKLAHRAKIRELKRETLKIRHFILHDDYVHVAGVIPRTREAEFISWCVKRLNK